jgi:hypothetical protein
MYGPRSTVSIGKEAHDVILFLEGDRRRVAGVLGCECHGLGYEVFEFGFGCMVNRLPRIRYAVLC